MKNILIVGLGSIGKKHIATIKNLYPMATIYVVSSSGSTVSTRIENVEFCQDILQAIKHSLDFAIVASPATFHSIHAQQLLNAKIPVLVEKPITANPQEAKQLIELAKQTKVPMKVAYCLRYLPSAKIIKILLMKIKPF